MALIRRKHYKKLYIIFFLILLNNCQLKEPKKAHGINFLENREKTLIIGKTNKNDILKLIGKPHTKSIKNEDTWIYFERTITRGKLIKLGQNVLKENNVLALEFDRFGILKNKKIYNKKDMKKIAYSSKETSNEITQQSFVNKFLSSIRQKMYGKRKF
jgi:outer membrane protein assembly factor BamE (lipoprotein component of BamABCDE complex)|tara:strand:+ start:510 stop:983 length:474 start_codon:yes stop_codon:yes gene_type:complete